MASHISDQDVPRTSRTSVFRFTAVDRRLSRAPPTLEYQCGFTTIRSASQSPIIRGSGSIIVPKEALKGRTRALDDAQGRLDHAESLNRRDFIAADR